MNRPPSLSLSAFALATTFLLGPYALSDDSPLTLNLRSRAKSQGQGAISVAEKAVAWAPETTAIIVCDMWGSSSRRHDPRTDRCLQHIPHPPGRYRAHR